MHKIRTEIWKPRDDGYLELYRRRSIREVYDNAHEVLIAAGVNGDLDYFSPGVTTDLARAWPAARCVACFVVPGNSEWHYIHVEAAGLLEADGTVTDRRELLLLGKTFGGFDVAHNIAGILARAFEEGRP